MDSELGLVPGANQMAVAHCSIGERCARMRAFALICADSFAVTDQHDFFLANFNLKTPILTKIGQASDPMHRHVTFLSGFLLGVGRA
jgi:hypothetical protein